MAQKDLEPQDVPFEIPEFNEDEFVRKELISFRTTIILFVFSLVVALVTLAIWKYLWASKDLNAGEWWLLVLVALSFGGALPFLYRAFKVDISHWKRREWLGTFTMHFFFWLGFSLLLVNPPISDDAPPKIEAFASPAVQSIGSPVTLAAYVGDNEGLDEAALRFCVIRLADPPATYTQLSSTEQAACTLAFTKPSAAQVWTYTWMPEQNGNYTFYVHAVDRQGAVSDSRIPVNITNPILFVGPSQNTKFNEDLQELKVQVAPGFNDILNVQYVIDGRAYNMTGPPKEPDVYWKSDPRFPGWKRGTNDLTFQVVEQPIHLHQYSLAGGVSKANGTSRTYSVEAGYPNFNTLKEPTHSVKGPPNLVGTPGFDTALLVAALGVATVAVALRTRRHA